MKKKLQKIVNIVRNMFSKMKKYKTNSEGHFTIDVNFNNCKTRNECRFYIEDICPGTIGGCF